MEQLQLLGVAVGISALAGINLYLTVFVTGLAIQNQWIALSPQYQSLSILGEPLIVILAGVLYFLEFFADKVPWVDSAWDSVHTAIRPIGAAFLSIQVLGDSSPVFEVVAALLGGGIALTTHSAKAGVRLLVNASPEPFSNIAVSFAEDVAVLGGLALIHSNPIVALVVFVLLIGGILYFLPGLLRSIRTTVWLVSRKLGMIGGETKKLLRDHQLPAYHDMELSRLNPLTETVAWALPCLSRKSPGVETNINGFLVATKESPEKLSFIGKSLFGRKTSVIDISDCKFSQETRMLTEELVIYCASRKVKYEFFVDRGRSKILAEAVGELKNRTPLKIESTARAVESELAVPV